MATLPSSETWVLPKEQLEDLVCLLQLDGYEIIGPRVDQQAIVYGPIESAKDLPIGMTDRQAPGSYRLEKRGDSAYFGYAVGPHSWKKYLFPPTLSLWKARRVDGKIEIQDSMPDPPRRALLGVRACELSAIAVQDKVFLGRDGRYTDPHYALARQRLLLIAVECEHPAGTCFCVSMGTGPDVRDPQKPGNSSTVDAARPPFFDLALTELEASFTVRSGSPAGKALLDRLKLAPASTAQVDDSQRRVAKAREAMGRTLDVTDIQALLHRNQENPRWDDVANRCLACTNCTLVCPTCFCSSVEDTTDLTLENAERTRQWDSCFNPEFAQVHGGNFRPSIRGRYRQWLTHKFASWIDQFGTSGCVGCGRCITWCPVGIDVTQEIAAIRAGDGQLGGAPP